MNNTIYKISYSIDNYGNKFFHEIRTAKYHCHEKDKCILIESERKRIHKDKIDAISNSENCINNTRGIRFIVWTLDESKIETHKLELKEGVLKQIGKYKDDINNLEKAMELDVIKTDKDYSYNE